MMIDVRNVVVVDASFSSRLRSLLVEHGMSQAELARRTGINYAALTATVNGRRRPTAKEVGLLAHELGVDLLELIGIADTVAEDGVLIEQREHLRGRLKAEQARASNTESSLRQAQHEAERAAETMQKQLARMTGECEELQRQLRTEEQRATKAEQAHAEGEQVRARLAGEYKELRRQLQAEQARADEARRRQNVQSFAEHKAWHRVAQVEAELADARKREDDLERDREELRQKVQEFETEAAQREGAEQPSASDHRWWRDDEWARDSAWESRRRQLIDELELDSDEFLGLVPRIRPRSPASMVAGFLVQEATERWVIPWLRRRNARS